MGTRRDEVPGRGAFEMELVLKVVWKFCVRTLYRCAGDIGLEHVRLVIFCVIRVNNPAFDAVLKCPVCCIVRPQAQLTGINAAHTEKFIRTEFPHLDSKPLTLLISLTCVDGFAVRITQCITQYGVHLPTCSSEPIRPPQTPIVAGIRHPILLRRLSVVSGPTRLSIRHRLCRPVT